MVPGAGHDTIPTLGSRVVPNPAQRAPIAPGPPRGVMAPITELRNPNEKQLGEASIPPPPQQIKCKPTVIADD